MKIIYYAGYALFWTAFNLIWRRRVYGCENVPKEGPVIIASNHLSLADPPVLGSSLPRIICYLAKEELFKPELFGKILKIVNAIPVKRGKPDIRALREMLSYLEKGGAALIFIEGTRQKPGEFGRPRNGVGFLARQSKATVVPTLLVGTDGLNKFKPISVVFGKPIDFSRPESSGFSDEDIARIVMTKIKSLYERFGQEKKSN